jgi:inner membrane protein
MVLKYYDICFISRELPLSIKQKPIFSPPILILFDDLPSSYYYLIMFIFGHIGITLSATILISQLIPQKRPIKVSAETSPETLTIQKDQSRSIHTWTDRLANFVDIRFLILGSLLPDLIDKPIGDFFFLQTFQNGRIFSHTLLFPVIIFIIALILRDKKSGSRLLDIGIGIIIHLILDFMWQTPETFFWPLYGWSFPKIGTSNRLTYWWSELSSDPYTYSTEIIGLLITLIFTAILVKTGKIKSFLFGR